MNNLLAAALPASALHVIDCTAAWKINLNSPLTTITKDDIQQAIQAGFIEKEV